MAQETPTPRRRITDGLKIPQTANNRQVGGDHYQSPIQHWDYVIANGIPYLEAQIIKYVTRWHKKGGMGDLEKARHFLDKLMEVNAAPSTMAGEAGRGYVDQDR